MKHNTASTSIQSHVINQGTGLYNRQEQEVLSVLIGETMTYNQLCAVTGIRESSMSRCIRGLLDKGVLTVDRIAKCPISGRSVRWLKQKSPQASLF